MTRVMSGLQPTADLHIGNYLGAIQPLLNLQKQEQYNDILCCIANLHSITVPYNPQQLKENSLKMAAMLLASGLTDSKVKIFVQSTVSAHAELAWILGCTARIGWLNRMTQFKDKAGKNREKASAGLYFYPVMMAADILLYDTSLVPVGEDQKQHLEFVRDIAIKFNNDYNTSCFLLPEPFILSGARIKSLRDGTQKMSKSDPSELSKILLVDNKDTIATKIKKAKTDDKLLPSSIEELEERPETSNLLNIYALIVECQLAQAVDKFKGLGFAPLKEALIEVITAKINPIRVKFQELMADEAYLQKILHNNSEYAIFIANHTLERVKHTIGF